MQIRLLTFMIFLLIATEAFGWAVADDSSGVDLHGRVVQNLSSNGSRVVVLVFAASDCPISNRYVPEIARLGQKFADKKVQFWWVFPNPEDGAEVVTRHNREFGINDGGDVATLLDRNQNTVRMAHVTTTPEAAVFVAQGRELREVYRGRIDDRYMALGQERPSPQRHELEDAIETALAGKPVPQPGGPPVGCSIVFIQK